jgi:cytochrome c553
MRTALRILGILLILLVVCCIGVVVVVIIQSNSALNKTYDVAAEEVPISDDPEVIARGEYLANTVALCTECHGENLGGDATFIDDPVLGTVGAPNLTTGKGGVGETFTDADYVRAIRHGVDPEGKPLVIMPAKDFNKFTLDDLGAVISYVKAQPPVDNEVDEPSLMVGRLFLLTSEALMLPASDIDHDAPFPDPIEPAITPEYGSYLASIGCEGCHGEDYAGQSFPDGSTPSANLTPAGPLADYSEEQFLAALKTGTKASGDVISTDDMPWDHFARLTEDDMSAIWAFLQSLPAVESES